MQSPHTIRRVAAAIRQGDVTPQTLLADCLARIDLYDSQVNSWVLVDRAGALRQAEVAASELASGHDRGPLHGIPIGIKDIVDVSGLPTRAGSLLTDPEPASGDASVVAALRRAGAVVLGKTVTTEFACFDPSPTRNPWNLDHTPGGIQQRLGRRVGAGHVLGRHRLADRGLNYPAGQLLRGGRH